MKKIFLFLLTIMWAIPAYSAQQTITSGAGAEHQWSVQKGRINNNFDELYLQAATHWISDGHTYTADIDTVTHGGKIYICTTTHNSSAAGVAGNEPGVGGNWLDVWKPIDASGLGLGTNSGTNTGDVTISTANGLSLSGQALSLVAATNSTPGAATAAQITELERVGSALTDGSDGEHGVWLTNNTANPNTYSTGKWGYTVYNNAPYWCYNGTCTAIPTSSGGITDIVQDTTPQLGGNLDLNGHVITGLQIGTNVQAYDADLTTWAGVTPGTGVATFLGTPSGANLAAALTTSLPPTKGGTGVANGSNNTITFTGNYTFGATLSANTAVTFPTSGTLATLGANTFTGNQALGANSLTMTGSIAATGNRVTKGWFTDIESTNMPTVGGTALPGVLSTKSGVHATPTTTNPLSPTWTGLMYTVWYGATGTINLPAASAYAGKGILIYNTGAFTITIDSNGSEVIVRDGTVQTGGVSMTLSSGAGNYVALLCDGARWVTLGYKGTLAAGS